MAAMRRYDLTMPELGLEQVPIVVSVWLAKLGSRVSAGDQLVELLAGCVTVDLPSPADGILVERCVEEGEPVEVGQCLAVVEC